MSMQFCSWRSLIISSFKTPKRQRRKSSKHQRPAGDLTTASVFHTIYGVNWVWAKGALYSISLANLHPVQNIKLEMCIITTYIWDLIIKRWKQNPNVCLNRVLWVIISTMTASLQRQRWTSRFLSWTFLIPVNCVGESVSQALSMPHTLRPGNLDRLRGSQCSQCASVCVWKRHGGQAVVNQADGETRFPWSLIS